MKTSIKSMSKAQRWVLHYMSRAEFRHKEGRGKFGERYTVRRSGTFRTPTMRKLESLGYVKHVSRSSKFKPDRWALTPRGRRLGLQIDAWMCGIGDKPGTPYKIVGNDERGNWFELLGNAHEPTMFVTVARHDDGEDDERVIEIECAEFFEKVDELRRALPKPDDSRPWITEARASR